MAVNAPPESGIRVPSDEMRVHTADLFEAAGTSRKDADLLGSVLVESDLRGIFSHGTVRAADYVGQILDGDVNPRPNIRIVADRGSTRVIDCDGGLGHVPCYEAAKWAVGEAKSRGFAGTTTRNHAHFGAAGTYSRLALEHDCIGIAISSTKLVLDPDRIVLSVNSSPPLSIAAPADRRPPLVMDMGVPRRWERRHFERYRQFLLKDLALASILHALGGILAGVYHADAGSAHSEWRSDHGAFIVIVDIAAFMAVDEFKQQMDRFIDDASNMRPIPGTGSADLAGGMEWKCEQDYSRNGIPVSMEHQRAMQETSEKLGVESPFLRFEHTRFEPAARDRKLAIIDGGKRLVDLAKRISRRKETSRRVQM